MPSSSRGEQQGGETEGNDAQIPGPDGLDEQSPNARIRRHGEDDEPPQNEGDDEGQGTKASIPAYHTAY